MYNIQFFATKSLGRILSVVVLFSKGALSDKTKNIVRLMFLIRKKSQNDPSKASNHPGF